MFQVQLEGATRSFDKGAERIFREQIYLPLSEPSVGRFIICRAAFIGLFIRSQAFMAQFIFRQVQGFVAQFCSAERRVLWPDSFSAECTAVLHRPIQFNSRCRVWWPAPFSAECRVSWTDSFSAERRASWASTIFCRVQVSWADSFCLPAQLAT